jgi:macrolide-specific efflux system membrane fusion protein
MARHKKLVFFLLLGVAVVGVFLCWGQINKMRKSKDGHDVVKKVQPQRGSIQKTISSTATILPKNRLEIKPPVSGRVDEIMVKEGDLVKQGEILAWMSSTERAALLDAARGQSEDQLKYWQDVYKSIPLIAPIDGEVIVAKTQPGQSVNSSEIVVVLSDRLIIRAQVDETDIAGISEGQRADVALDAYPDERILSVVEHIYYESRTINNVTMYEVDLVSVDLPDFVRSGMNANVEFHDEIKNDVMILPLSAINRQNEESWVWIQQSPESEPVKRVVKLGSSDDRFVEIVSGLNESDTVIIKSKKYSLPQNNSSTNPFVPSGPRR